MQVICLMGPTASGKTPMAIELAQTLPIQIISVDSAMVYRGMNIGTAKPCAEVLKLAPHRLIDLCDPKDAYSAGRFLHDVTEEIEQAYRNKKVPVLVGGTMLYFNVLQNGFADLPRTQPEIRDELQRKIEAVGVNGLYAELQVIDPVAAKRIKSNDKQRIQRALEVYKQTGRSITQWHESTSKPTRFIFHNFALMVRDRAQLHQRIKLRFQEMLDAGLMHEIEALYARGDLHADLCSLRTVGYRQAWQYLSGTISFKEMQEKAIIATRQLAKRQITWLRSWEEVTFLEYAENQAYCKIKEKVTSLLEQVNF